MDRVEIHHDGHGFFLCGHGVPGRDFVSEGPAMKVSPLAPGTLMSNILDNFHF